MKTKELRKKNIDELNAELLNLSREQFSLHMQSANNQIQKTHMFKVVRRDIARIKTLLTE